MKTSTLRKPLLLFALAALLGFTALSFKPAETPSNGDIRYIEAVKADGSEKKFSDIMADFKGKIVFIDFWASWCGPCRGEFQYSPAIHEKFKDNPNVVFLYITFDQNKEAWQKAVEKYTLAGFHLYPGADLKKEVYERFDVTGIPRYMIMGKDGSVLNDNAPRPSTQEELINEIEKSLKK